MLPIRRRIGLLVEDLAEETLVYDLSSHRAHCLSRTARLVWERCDGQTSVEAIAAVLNEQLGVPADVRLVWLALDQLAKARLLEGGPLRLTEREPTTRRDLIRALGLTAAIVPVVTSILAPTAAASMSVCTGRPPCVRLGGCPPGQRCQSVAGRCICVSK